MTASRRELAGGAVVGVPTGLLVLWMAVFSPRLSKGLYLLIGTCVAVFAPHVVAWLGGAAAALALGFGVAFPLDMEFLVHYRERGNPAGTNGLGVTPVLLVSLATLAWSTSRAWRGLPRAPGALRRLVGPAVLLVGASTVSLLNTVDRTQCAYGIALQAGMVATAAAAARLAADGGDTALRRLYLGLMLALVAEGLVVLVQFALGTSFDLRGTIVDRGATAAAGTSVLRYTGTFAVPSATGTFLSTGLLLVLPLVFDRGLGLPRWLGWASFGTGLLGLALTLTRSAWIQLAVGAALLSPALYRRRLLRPQTLLAAGLAVAAAALVAGPLLAARVGAPHESDFFVRWNLVLIGTEMLAAHPLAGVGMNTAWLVLRHYVPAGWGGTWVFVPHNQFLLAAAETGIPGALALVWLLAAGIRACRGAGGGDSALARQTAASLRVVLWMLVVALTIDFVQGSPTYALVFFTVGLALGLEARGAAARPAPEGAVP